MDTPAARAETYLTLSEIFKPPLQPFLSQLFDGTVKRQMDEWLKALGSSLFFPDCALSATKEEFAAALKEEYSLLFEGPVRPFAMLVESVHKPWDARGGSILGGEKGYIMGDSAQEMMERYKAAGIGIPRSFSHQPDHLALLLEYLSITIDKTSESDQLLFINRHLDWIGDVLKEIEENKNARHYPAFVGFLENFLKEDSRRLQQ